MLSDPDGLDAEPFELLVSALETANRDRGARTIMFTSARRGQGTSTTVANLAIALARAGRRVALVDLDLREPSVGELFAVGDRPGVTGVLLKRATLEQALVPVAAVTADEAATQGREGDHAGGLAVLPAGAVPASPADVARSPALAELLAALEAKADLVLVDAPPVLGPSDARSLAARVDALVVVARRAAIRNGKAAELHRALTGTPVVKLGFVLTGAGHVGSRRAPRPRSADA